MGTNDRILICCTCHFQGGSLCFSFFHLLVSSDFRPDTRRAWWTVLLGSLVQSRCGEGGMLQTNNTGECARCPSHTGPVPAHGTHSSGSRLLLWNRLRPALGCMHFPGLSRSGSGTQVVPRGADWLDLRFVPFPGPSSSGVWRARSL